jgi:predicted nucleic acid-binding protein
MDRVFLDANVIFSAAYNPRRRLGKLWQLSDVELVTSDHAAAEALRNLRLKYPSRVEAATRMLDECGIVRIASLPRLRRFPELSESDALILMAAIRCRANFLLTGDQDFARYFGRLVDGVMILRPGDYLRMREMPERE